MMMDEREYYNDETCKIDDDDREYYDDDDVCTYDEERELMLASVMMIVMSRKSM